MARIVGIVPTYPPGAPGESNMLDYYKLGNNYTKQLTRSGCIPICLAPADNWLTQEALELCDGFLVQGGSCFKPYHFQVIHHAVCTGKRYLGICLGQQLIYVYFELRRRVEEAGFRGDLVQAMWQYLQAQGKGFSLQRRVPGHYSELPPRGCEDQAKHEVNIVPGTLLHRVVGQDTIRIASFHHCNTPLGQSLVTVNAWSALGDEVIEGTEHGGNILGIQGHPEVDGLLPCFFSFLAES